MTPERPAADTLPRPLLLFLWASLALTLAAFLHAWIMRHLGFGLPYSNPYYYVPGDRFEDFRGFMNKYQSFGTPAFFTPDEGFFMYPTPMVFVFRPFMLVYATAAREFLAFLFLVSAVLIAGFTRILRAGGLRGYPLGLFVVSTVVLSYPLLFEWMRWNIEILIFALISFALWAFWRERFYQAAILFGIATSLKLFPLIFFGLLFARRRYREMAAGVAVAGGVTLLALALLGPSIAQAFAWDNLQLATFRAHFAGVPNALGYDHSFFGLLKWIMLPWNRDLTSWVSPYTRFAGVAGLALYFLRIWKLPRLNQVIVLSVLAVTLAPTSFDYTLLSLYPAFLLLALRAIAASRSADLTERSGDASASVLTPYFLLFAVIFTPLSFVVWHGGRYAAQLRCLALLAVIVLALRTPLPELEPAAEPLTHQG